MESLIWIIVAAIIGGLLKKGGNSKKRTRTPEERRQDRENEMRARKAVEAQQKRMQPKQMKTRKMDAKPFVVKERTKKTTTVKQPAKHTATRQQAASSYEKQMKPHQKSDVELMMEEIAEASKCNNVNVHSEMYDEKQLLDKVYDMIVMGPDTRIPGERDFEAEAMAMISEHTAESII